MTKTGKMVTLAVTLLGLACMALAAAACGDDASTVSDAAVDAGTATQDTGSAVVMREACERVQQAETTIEASTTTGEWCTAEALRLSGSQLSAVETQADRDAFYALHSVGTCEQARDSCWMAMSDTMTTPYAERDFTEGTIACTSISQGDVRHVADLSETYRCDFSLDDFNACLDGLAQDVIDVYRGFRCTGFDSEETTDLAFDVELHRIDILPSCEAFATACPTAFDGLGLRY